MPADPLPSFGLAHAAIVAAVPLLAAALTWSVRRSPSLGAPVRLSLASALAVDALSWHVVAFARGAVRPPHGLPLDLCDAVLWVTVYALVTGRRAALDAAYFLGIAGSGMALLTPDIGSGASGWEAAQFFAAHGLVVAAVLFLVLSGALTPRPRAWLRVFLIVNVYAAFVAVLDASWGTNYMYLREKPQSGTLLDLLGPWPLYIVAAEPVALALLFALDLPFRRRRRLHGDLGSPAARPPQRAERWLPRHQHRGT